MQGGSTPNQGWLSAVWGAWVSLRGRLTTIARPVGWALLIVLWIGTLAFAFVGIGALEDTAAAVKPIVGLVLLAFTVYVVYARYAGLPLGRIAVWPGALLYSLVVLVGVLSQADDNGIDWGLGSGLLAAGAVILVAGFAYLSVRLRPTTAGLGGFLLVALILVAVPAIAHSLLDDPKKVTGSGKPVRSKMDVALIVDGRAGRDVPRLPEVVDAEEWDVRYSVAHVDGADLRWTLVDSVDERAAWRAVARPGRRLRARPQPRPDADAAVVLMPDGSDPVVEDLSRWRDLSGDAGEIDRWRALAAAPGIPSAPVFAVLETATGARIKAWNRWLEREHDGGASSFQRLVSGTVTDAALRVAVTSPDVESDMGLALKHLPLLYFDKDEETGFPLDIDRLFGSGLVQLCSRDLVGTSCNAVTRSAQLANGATHLRIGLPRPGQRVPPELLDRVANVTAETTLYVHVVEQPRRKRIYLDYWWYLPFNPANTGKGSFCGPGLTIVGATCFDHASDWEGLTVELDSSQQPPQPLAVHYAQHSAVVRYDWEALRTFWEQDAYAALMSEVGPAASERPLGFVAKGTHATYPRICPGRCVQVAESDRTEKPARGGNPWPGNIGADCKVRGCLRALPIRRKGRSDEPVLWNSFEGPWGERNCVLTYYCDTAEAPTAPAGQGRYKHPWTYSGTATPQGRYTPRGG